MDIYNIYKEFSHRTENMIKDNIVPQSEYNDGVIQGLRLAQYALNDIIIKEISRNDKEED